MRKGLGSVANVGELGRKCIYFYLRSVIRIYLKSSGEEKLQHSIFFICTCIYCFSRDMYQDKHCIHVSHVIPVTHQQFVWLVVMNAMKDMT